MAQDLAHTQREMNLYTAQEEGLTDLLTLLGREGTEGDQEALRQTAAALLRIGGDSFTLEAMNRHPAGVWNFRQSGGDGDAA